MRVKLLITAVIALSAGAIVASNLYHRYDTNSVLVIAEQYSSATPVGSVRAGKKFSFTEMDTPKPVPVLKFVDGAGRELTLKSFEGQTVLLNIWATWCIPCQEEMPSLDRLQAKLGSVDFRVVPLSIDREGLPAVKAFYEELGLQSLGIYVDQTGKASRLLSAVGIPTTLLVDREGREIGRTVGPAEWDSNEVIQTLKRYMGHVATEDVRSEDM